MNPINMISWGHEAELSKFIERKYLGPRRVGACLFSSKVLKGRDFKRKYH